MEPMNTEAAEPSAPEHVAKLYGEPLPEMPKDLYIPPDALEVYLESFEGPLDLLLYMIRRANINILDIPMAPLTAQYLEYVEAMRARNLELAAEYLLMAAMLLEIKSRMLLPRPKKVEEEETLDPRAELVRRLLEYEQMKAAAAKIDALPQAMRDYQWVSIWITDEVAERLPDVNLHDLQVAWLSLMKHAKVMQHHKVRREELSVREHMSIVLRKLQGGTFLEFAELFDLTLGVAGLVVNFLAVLELTRERLVEVTQREVFAPIYVKLAQSATGSNDVDFPTVHA
ncbi:MAG: segregation/condensation protein A [Betaproteobacteria bacterium HGW-Betaproteobacteria-14]|jgi:segregation and condensation protein A|nr:MAG: segregation/condensation protein A [Betaproteobacteria bacterium HGW-Betaproteobacteria-14]